MEACVIKGSNTKDVKLFIKDENLPHLQIKKTHNNEQKKTTKITPELQIPGMRQVRKYVAEFNMFMSTQPSLYVGQWWEI